MASGLDMYYALRNVAGRLHGGGTLKINPSDKQDLCKLTVEDLTSVGFDEETAQAIALDLSKNSFDRLGKEMGVALMMDKQVLNLIPGEALKRAAEALKDDPQSLEEMLEELASMRSFTRCCTK